MHYKILIFFANFELVLPWTKFYFVFQVIISLGRVSFDDVSLFSWSLWWYLNGESKSTQKIKDKTRWRRNISKKLTGDEKSTAINPELSCRAIVSKHLRFVNLNFDPKFFRNFRQKNVIFNPNLEKTTNSNRWGKHFWYPHRLPKLGKHLQRRAFLGRVFSEQMIFCVFFYFSDTEKVGSKTKQEINQNDHLFQHHNWSSFYSNSCIVQIFHLLRKLLWRDAECTNDQIIKRLYQYTMQNKKSHLIWLVKETKTDAVNVQCQRNQTVYIISQI